MRRRSPQRKRIVDRGPTAEIDLAALRHNLAVLRKCIRGREIIGVVKADAYGHGATTIAKMLAENGVSTLAVAFTSEARALREAGIDTRILVLFDRTDLSDYFEYDLIPVLYDARTAKALAREARKRGVVIPVHMKIDTGMGRLGFHAGEAEARASELSGLEGIRVAGVLSHFSEADLTDRSYAVHQLDLFRAIRKKLNRIFRFNVMYHMANSAAILSLEDALFDAVRPGLMLYGCSPFRKTFDLRPVMGVKTRIITVRNVAAGTPLSYGRTFVTQRRSRIAVVPVGYADGYSRLLSNNAEMLVRGRRVPVVGRVCMDITLADITGIKDVTAGDEVFLLGGSGREQITASELSARADSIPYEILTSLGRSSRREYVN